MTKDLLAREWSEFIITSRILEERDLRFFLRIIQQQQPLYRPYLLIIQPKKKRADARKTKQSTRSV